MCDHGTAVNGKRTIAITRKLCYRKDDRVMRLIKLLPVSILTTQSDNMHMVCCWKVHFYHLVGILIAGLYTDKNKAKTAVSVAVEAKPEVEIWRRPKKIERELMTSYRPPYLNAFLRYCRFCAPARHFFPPHL